MFLISLAEATNDEEWRRIEQNFSVTEKSNEQAEKALKDAFERWSLNHPSRK